MADHPVVPAQIAVDRALQRIQALLDQRLSRPSLAEIEQRQHIDRQVAQLTALLLEKQTWMDGHRRAMCEIALLLQAVDLTDAEKLKRIGWWVQSV